MNMKVRRRASSFSVTGKADPLFSLLQRRANTLRVRAERPAFVAGYIPDRGAGPSNHPTEATPLLFFFFVNVFLLVHTE